MRFEGKLKTWNDERGFGFIEPLQGGDEIFVHIKAFSNRRVRPVINQLLSFEVELGQSGKKQAKNVELVRITRSAALIQQETMAQWSTTSKFAIPAFVLVYAVIATIWHVSWYFAIAYILVSLVTFLAYAFDKSAAKQNRWRTPESTLLFFGLVCGWPGALLAQQLLRHKSNKASFRSAFWVTVLFNMVGFVVLNTPLLHNLLK